MPRPTKGARLERRESGLYHIRDGGRRVSTGTRDSREAETALAAYIAGKDRPAGPRGADQISVAEVLEIYATERAPHVKDPARIADCIAALVPILGALPLSAITGEVCRGMARRATGRPARSEKSLAPWRRRSITRTPKATSRRRRASDSRPSRHRATVT